jgi:hypothetical protein
VFFATSCSKKPPEATCIQSSYFGDITPLVGDMKKQQVKRTASNLIYLPIGVVIRELVLWDFSGDEHIIRHNANELAKALQMSYNLDNFGPSSFGIDDED